MSPTNIWQRVRSPPPPLSRRRVVDLQSLSPTSTAPASFDPHFPVHFPPPLPFIRSCFASQLRRSRPPAHRLPSPRADIVPALGSSLPEQTTTPCQILPLGGRLSRPRQTSTTARVSGLGRLIPSTPRVALSPTRFAPVRTIVDTPMATRATLPQGLAPVPQSQRNALPPLALLVSRKPANYLLLRPSPFTLSPIYREAAHAHQCHGPPRPLACVVTRL